MPRINLLPWRDEQRRERKLAFFVALGGAVALAAIAAFIAYLLLGSMIDAQERRNDRLRAEIKSLDKQIEEINDLEAQKQRFISRMQIIEKLQRSRPEVVHLFDELVKQMPDGTYLTAVKQTDPPEARRRGAVLDARVDVYAQHRRLAVAAESGARGGRDQEGRDRRQQLCARCRAGHHAPRMTPGHQGGRVRRRTGAGQ